VWWSSKNQNSIPETIKSRMNSGNVCYQSMQNRLSPDCSTNIKIKGIQNCNFASWFVWVRNCVSHIEEHGLMVFGNKMLRKVFGPKVTGEWKRLHNEDLNDLYSSPKILGVIKPTLKRRAGHVLSGMREWKCAYRVMVRKPEGKRLVWKPWCWWQDNITTDLQEVGWGARTGLIWLSTGTDRKRLWMW
jgi:hypothetical protein